MHPTASDMIQKLVKLAANNRDQVTMSFDDDEKVHAPPFPKTAGECAPWATVENQKATQDAQPELTTTLAWAW